MSAGDKFTSTTTADEVVAAFGDQIKDRYIVVTGTSPGGLGFETARAIATKSPKLLVLASRDAKKNEQARADILKDSPNVDIKTVILDLNSLASVRQAAKDIIALGNVDVLINNAAVMMCPYGTTEDGLEIQFGSNTVGPWLLSNLLVPSMLKTPHPRIVCVASSGHQWGDVRWDDPGFDGGKAYDKAQAYGQSKTGNIYTARGLADKYGKDGLVSISLHPGAIMTNLGRHMTEEELAPWKPLFFNEDGSYKTGLAKTIPQGASTQLVAAFDPRMDAVNGAYLTDCQVAKDLDPSNDPATATNRIAQHAKDPAAPQKLWDLLNKITGEHF